MASSKTPSTDILNSANGTPEEPDDGPILEQLDEKRCGICHEIIINACRVSCGHHFCRHCLDRKRTGDTSKSGENGTPKCNVCNAAINEVQNLSELDQEIDELYSHLPMKARLDRAALKTQRQRQVDTWKRRPIVQSSLSATKPSTSTQQTSPIPRRRGEEYVFTPRRNRGVYPERQRSFPDIYRENLNPPQRQRSTPSVHLLFQDISGSRGSSEETLQSRYDPPTSSTDVSWNSRTTSRQARERRESSLSLESQGTASRTSIPEYTSNTRPLVIHETYTIRRTRVVDTSRSPDPLAQLDYGTESNYLNDMQEDDEEYPYRDAMGSIRYRPSEDLQSFYNDLNSSSRRYGHLHQYQSPWSTATNHHQSTPTPTSSAWHSDDSPLYSSSYLHQNLHTQPGYYSFLPPVMVTPVAATPAQWCEHTTFPLPGCPCGTCSRGQDSTDLYYEDEPSAYYEMSGRTSSEELHSSADSNGFGYSESTGTSYFDQMYDEDPYNMSNFDINEPSQYSPMNDTDEIFNQPGIDTSVNLIGYSSPHNRVPNMMEGAGYMGNRTEYSQHEDGDPPNQNVVDSFYSSAAGAGGRSPHEARSGGDSYLGRYLDDLTPTYNQMSFRGSAVPRGNLAEFAGGERGSYNPRRRDGRESGIGGSGSRLDEEYGVNIPRDSLARDTYDFDEFGPEISVTEAIIGFRR